MKSILLIFALCATTLLCAQAGKLKKANQYYDRIAYAPAAALYEEILGSESDSPEVKSKLAYCYLQIGNIARAEEVYKQAVGGSAPAASDYYYYAQVLKQTGKYDESDKWMKKYHEVANSDSRAQEFVANENYISQIEKMGNRFSISTLNINSEAADFGGYTTGNLLFFISSRTDNPHVKRTWAWNNKQFLDLYSYDLQGGENAQPKIHTKRVNTRFHEGPLCFSPDGKKVYYTRNNIASGSERRDNKGIQNLKLYVADVINSHIWINEREFQYNSKEFSVGHPSISADGKTLYFVSDMPGGIGGADIYKTEILQDGSYGKPENLGKTVNTEGQDMFPWINSENLLFFSSDGHVGLGGLDVFVAMPAKNGSYTKLLNVGKPVNSNRDDFAFVMDKSSMAGYFSSNRAGGKGDDDIYTYKMEKPFKKGIVASGTVIDKATGAALANATVILRDASGKEVAKVIADEKGQYSFDLEENTNYTIAASNTDYFDNSVPLSTVNSGAEDSFVTEIPLEKDPGLALYGLIIDRKTGEKLEGVKIKMLEYPGNKEFLSIVTDASGDFMKPLTEQKVNDELNYTIVLEKEGYLTKTVLFSYKIERPGIINIHQYLNIAMEKPEAGMDLATIINIRPIYFDLGKYNIRPDAAAELNKIVDVMNKYPTMVVELGSHTDCRGSIASNAKLSDNRAKASAAYIAGKISNPERIYGKGYGESKLKNGCACEGKVKPKCSEAVHQENRRTEFVIIKM